MAAFGIMTGECRSCSGGVALAGYEQPLPIVTADILPTIAGVIGLTIPRDEIDGHCHDLDPGAANTCR